MQLQYPLAERIGDPSLLVGREKEFKELHEWIARIPDRLSKSRALLGRRKSGKTAILQRIFNELWSANEMVIPFYISIPESRIWHQDFASLYYRTFATQYISFLKRDPTLVHKLPLNLEQILDHGIELANESLIDNTKQMIYEEGRERSGLMWEIAYNAPHSTAAVQNQRFVVMIDEFQYLSTNIYMDKATETSPNTTMPGSFHHVSESKLAPMLVAGSYIGWMQTIMHRHLKAGRLSRRFISPYLEEGEGLDAVYQYAEVFKVPISNDTAYSINDLCGYDPFFISCVIQSDYAEKDLTDPDGVTATVDYEVQTPTSELAGTWYEYIQGTVKRINDRYGKQMILHLSKHNNRTWTPKQLKEALYLDEDENRLYEKLIALAKGDLIQENPFNDKFQGLQDGTLNLILRHHFEEEIKKFKPDLRADFEKKLAASEAKRRSIQNRYNDLVGKTAEHYLATKMKTRKRFKLSAFFNDVPTGDPYDTRLNMYDVRTRVYIQREDGLNRELDIVAKTTDERILLVEVKKEKRKSGTEYVKEFVEKVTLYQRLHPENVVLAGFLSLGGFTEDALELCREHDIGWSNNLDGVSF
ncbi:MAG: BREX system ATP-binding domain-containing protein [Chloroflexota bacterium]